jgi:hypothetical protein
MLTTRLWGGAAVLLCFLLSQNCQSTSLRATEEEEPAESLSLSASAMRQRTFGEPLAVCSLPPSSTFSAAHVSFSRFSTTLASKEACPTTHLTSSLSLVARHILVPVNNFPKVPYNLLAAAMLRASHAVLSGNTPGHALSPDDPIVCVSKVKRVLREVPSDAEEDSKPLFKRRFANLAPKDDLANKKIRDGEGVGPDKATQEDKDIRSLALKALGEVEGRHCVEQGGQSGDVLTILLDMAGSEPNKASQLLDVLLVTAQNNNCRQQALKGIGRVAQASSGMFSTCLPSLRAAAKARDEDVRLLALKTLGEVEWKHYFGEVGPAPDLPISMTAILDSTCPFWPGKKVRDTHLLVLIPAKVNGQPFSLNLLSDLIQHPNNGGHKARYSYYNSHVQAQIGAESPSVSYWLLMTRDVLPGSRNKTYADHKKIVAAHASRSSLPYELPKALEAATTILTHHVRNGERLYSNSPWTVASCQELISYRSGEYPVVIGGFAPSGLDVYDVGISPDNESRGVAGCRKFF